MHNLLSRLLPGALLLLSLSCAHQYHRGSYPNPPSAWPPYHPHQQGATVGRPAKGAWGSPHWPRPGVITRPTTPSTTPALVDRLGAAETVYPYPPRGQSPAQNSVSNGGCQVGSKLYKIGDKWTPEGGCGRISCMPGGKTSTLGCPAADPASRCAAAEPDSRQPWPLCCPQVRC